MKPLRLSYIATLLLALTCVFSFSSSAMADSRDAKEKYRDIQEQIKAGSSKLKQAKRAEDITLTELERTNRKLAEVSRELKSYRSRMAKTRREAKSIQKDIETIEKKIATRKEWIRRKLQAMQRYGQYGDVLLVLGASEDVPQLLRRWHYLETLAGLEASVVEDLRKDVTALNDKKTELARIADRLKTEERQVAKSEADLKRQKEEREAMLAMVRQKKSSYERMLRDLRKSAARMQKIINESDPSSRYIGKGFRGKKGRLPWPVQGRIVVPYGSQTDPEFHTPVFRNGVYIGTPSDAVAHAVSSGRVVYADWFKGYGQLVIINHGGGYHSLYGNLSEIFLKAGDIIERDAKIGRVGTSGMLERPSLYFEVRYKGRPLDPSRWLTRR
jgi:septal ring factor EnvC (AmiA/AmiB activator)